MAQQSFTTEEFLALMGQSPVVKAMKPLDVYVLIQFAMDPESQQAQNIYAILQEEQKRIAHAEKAFNEITDNIMNELETGVTDIKKKAHKEKLQQATEDVREKEKQEAEELLQSIKK